MERDNPHKVQLGGEYYSYEFPASKLDLIRRAQLYVKAKNEAAGLQDIHNKAIERAYQENDYTLDSERNALYVLMELAADKFTQKQQEVNLSQDREEIELYIVNSPSSLDR